MCKKATANKDNITKTAFPPKNVPLIRPTTPQVEAQGTTQERAINNSCAGDTTYIAAKANKKGHNRFPLQTKFRHGIIKHIGDTGHIPDVLHKSENKADSKYIASHLQGKRNSR